MRGRELLSDAVQNHALDHMTVKVIVFGAPAIAPAGGAATRLFRDYFVIGVTASSHAAALRTSPSVSTSTLVDRVGN